jgi:hypothetical protein
MARKPKQPHSWEPMQFSRTTEAKGRNGWFVLDRGDIIADQQHTWLELLSKRLGRSAPISVRFGTPTDMRTLGQALLEAAKAWEVQAETDSLREETWHVLEEALQQSTQSAIARPEDHHQLLADMIDEYLDAEGYSMFVTLPGLYDVLSVLFADAINEERIKRAQETTEESA